MAPTSASSKSIARMARAFKIQAIAERVESRDVMKRLGELGVSFAQGYFIAVPQSVCELPVRSATASQRLAPSRNACIMAVGYPLLALCLNVPSMRETLSKRSASRDGLRESWTSLRRFRKGSLSAARRMTHRQRMTTAIMQALTTSHRLCIAPMMDRTDRHFRYFLRAARAERAALHGDDHGASAAARRRRAAAALRCSEHPVALQLGGSEPDELAAAATIGARRATTRSTSTSAARATACRRGASVRR